MFDFSNICSIFRTIAEEPARAGDNFFIYQAIQKYTTYRVLHLFDGAVTRFRKEIYEHESHFLV